MLSCKTFSEESSDIESSVKKQWTRMEADLEAAEQKLIGYKLEAANDSKWIKVRSSSGIDVVR